MIRDYTQATLDKLLAEIDSINRNNWSWFTDFLGDRWLKLGKALRLVSLEDDLSNLESYQRKVLDMNNTTKEELRQIFERVYEVDSSYSRHFDDLLQRQQIYNAKITKLTEMITPHFSIAPAATISEAVRGFNSTFVDVNESINNKIGKSEAQKTHLSSAEVLGTGGLISMLVNLTKVTYADNSLISDVPTPFSFINKLFENSNFPQLLYQSISGENKVIPGNDVEAVLHSNEVGRFWSSELQAKWEEYLSIIKSDMSEKEKMDAAIKWLKSLRGDANTIKDYYKWITNQDDVSFPEPLKDSFDFIKALDAYNKLISGTGEVIQGIKTGDTQMMGDGAKDLYSFLSGKIKTGLKSDDILFNQGSDLIVSYGKNMVSNWIDSIQTETKSSEVYWNTFANSAVEVFHDKVCNTPTLAIAYIPTSIAAKVMGIDLQAQYESVSDETGFAAVTDSVERLHDLFMENSTWENWKSGMGIIVNKIKNIF